MANNKPIEDKNQSHAKPHAEKDSHADHGPNGDHAHEGDGHGHADHSHDWSMEKAMDFHLSPSHLIGHVQDAEYFEGFGWENGHKKQYKIPQISPWNEETPLVKEQNDFLGPTTFQPTKFIVLELIGALIVCAIFIPYARRIKDGSVPRAGSGTCLTHRFVMSAMKSQSLALVRMTQNGSCHSSGLYSFSS